jgi:hypothetical protein
LARGPSHPCGLVEELGDGTDEGEDEGGEDAWSLTRNGRRGDF